MDDKRRRIRQLPIAVLILFILLSNTNQVHAAGSITFYPGVTYRTLAGGGDLTFSTAFTSSYVSYSGNYIMFNDFTWGGVNFGTLGFMCPAGAARGKIYQILVDGEYLQGDTGVYAVVDSWLSNCVFRHIQFETATDIDIPWADGGIYFQNCYNFGAWVITANSGVEMQRCGGYNPVGNVATPYPVAAGYIRDTAAAQAFPTSNTNYIIQGSPKLITIYGGTITSVSIDGIVTGQTGATTFAVYRLEPEQILNVVWVDQPSSVVYAC